MTYDETYINNKIKGTVAEQLFELIHTELRCQVLRTGHEYLYPNLFSLARIKKTQAKKERTTDPYLELIKSEDEEYKEYMRKVLGQIKFANDPFISFLSSSPDFTIITPTGNILQFEVKQRDNKIGKTEINRYLELNNPPFIFVILSKKPYIQIFEPTTIFKFKNEIPVSSWVRFQAKEDYIDETLSDKARSKFNTIYTKKEREEMSDIEVQEKLFNIKKKLSKNLLQNIYTEVPYDKNGNMTLSTSMFSDENLVYNALVIKKYQNIIKNFMIINNND